ncbi:hypothetical protein MT355_20565 [Rathayibacter sp. VKM Ac-2929]|uniref:hypothetical protein n=1 Tax=Rathayibacter sp. VKM Ac-2929 TaxID=2929480 RepID=UPI001FB3D432|nr:hypothetical protein [Rathayibacter sp. VKM Ac-2929]MCJ1675667.1 hypothetical protein [Rathayibacter sp. VKM Ac-2929]
MTSVELLNACPRDDAKVEALFSSGWPAFISAGHLAKKHLPQVRERFTRFELVVLDEDVPVAAGRAVLIQWNGAREGLPAGYGDSLRRALVKEEEDGATTRVVCAGQVHPDCTGAGLAGPLLGAFRDLSVTAGHEHVIVPLRPTVTPRYPLTPIDVYAAWTRGDGLLLDSRLRTHVRKGARVLNVAPRSQVMTGTVVQWEEWTGMALPWSGEYVIPGGL